LNKFVDASIEDQHDYYSCFRRFNRGWIWSPWWMQNCHWILWSASRGRIKETITPNLLRQSQLSNSWYAHALLTKVELHWFYH